MNLQRELVDYEHNSRTASVIYLEFVALELLAWKQSESFLIGILTFIGISLLFLVPCLNKIIALTLTASWCVGAYLITSTLFGLWTSIGITILMLFYIKANLTPGTRNSNLWPQFKISSHF